MILHTGLELNILGARTEDINGVAYGQMLIEAPENLETLRVIREFLHAKGIPAELVHRQEVTDDEW